MNSDEIVKRLAGTFNKTQKEMHATLKRVVGVFRESLAKHNSFTIPSFGTFDTQERKHRKAYNPHYKKMMLIPRKIVGVFRPSRVLDEKVNKS